MELIFGSLSCSELHFLSFWFNAVLRVVLPQSTHSFTRIPSLFHKVLIVDFDHLCEVQYGACLDCVLRLKWQSSCIHSCVSAGKLYVICSYRA